MIEGVGVLSPTDSGFMFSGVPNPERQDGPKTLGEVGHRLWLETLNLLAEYGTLVIFGAGEAAAEVSRQGLNLPTAANVAVLVAEAVAAATMIAPKAIRAVGEIVQVFGIEVHRGGYALWHGVRRPTPKALPPESDEPP